MGLNICLIHTNPFNPKIPARPEILEIYGNILPSFGHEIIWITQSSEKEKKVEEKIFKKIHIYIIPNSSSSSFTSKVFNHILYYVKEYGILNNLIKKEKFDIIQVRNDFFSFLLALHIKNKYNIPFVFQYSFPLGIYENKRKKNFYSFCLVIFEKFFIKNILKKADFILPISKWMENELIEMGIPKSKMMLLPMGINPNSFYLSDDKSIIRQKFGLESAKIILYIGSMDGFRKLDTIIYAFSKIKENKKNNFKLLMVGDGNCRSTLENLSISLGLKNDIIFTGEVSYYDVPYYIAASDVCLCPVPPLSIYKVSSPTKLFEYMVMKKPVVANEEIPEQKEVIKESGGGILVKFNEKSFAEGIMKLFNDLEMAKMMGEKGYEWVVNHRSYESIAHELEKKYYEILKTYNKS